MRLSGIRISISWLWRHRRPRPRRSIFRPWRGRPGWDRLTEQDWTRGDAAPPAPGGAAAGRHGVGPGPSRSLPERRRRMSSARMRVTQRVPIWLLPHIGDVALGVRQLRGPRGPEARRATEGYPSDVFLKAALAFDE